jgi:hypothetical protein
MLRTMLNLECDMCRNPYPACGICPSPVDGAIVTPQGLRNDAKEEGWTRPHLTRGLGDLCPRCTKKRAAIKGIRK